MVRLRTLGPAVLAAAAVAVSLEPTAQTRFAAAIERGQKALQELIASGRAPGASVAVALDGKIVWSEGFGAADLEHSVAVTDSTLFGIGSISKTLTMTAAVRLWQQGRLDLDAPIERYVPDFPHKGRGITVRRLAAHQSGLSDKFAADHYTTARHFDSLDAAFREMKEGTLDYEPGSQMVYATGTYTLIGRILEIASGREYRRLMTEEVFIPAGALNLVPNDRRAIIRHRSEFYANSQGGGFEHGPYFDPSFKLPGAGYLATASDLATFGSALLDSRLLTDRGRREMFQPVPLRDGTPTDWALGIQVTKNEDGGVWHIPGGGIGISSWLFIHPDAKMVIALLANVNTAPVGGRVYREIAAAFLAERRASAR